MLHTTGFTPSEVTKLLPGISRTTICQTIKKLEDEQTLNHRPGAGHSFKVDEASRHRLCAIASLNRSYTSASQITEKMRMEGIEIRDRTTRRYLNRLGFCCCWFCCLPPKKVSLLTEACVHRTRIGAVNDSWLNTFFVTSRL